jgi:hypothetical protein
MVKVQDWLDEKGKLKPEILRRSALTGAVIGSAVWGAVAVAGAIMLVGFGAWGWVVWPLAFYLWVAHVGRAVKAYKSIVSPQKWEQVVNVTVNAEPSAEQIVSATNHALREQSAYGGWAASGYRTEEELQSGR